MYLVSLKILVLKVEIDFRELIRKSAERLGLRGFVLSCFMERY